MSGQALELVEIDAGSDPSHKATDKVRERSFVVESAGRPVPGALWTPAGGEARALVLMGHGASGHKRQDYLQSLAHILVTEHEIAAASIDGPVHGSRREDGGKDGRVAFLDFATRWSSDTSMTDRMVEDWRHALDALATVPGIGEGPVGYWGLSMGTILGLPFVAAEPRIKAAVLGLMGATGPTSARIVEDARKITCPVLFVAQWEDELFPKETAFSLFAELASKHKSLHANPGAHGAVPRHEFASSARFLAERLR